MSNRDEQLTKSNGLGTDPMQRLASIKPPRDYTLGAAKVNKKVFTPNLNVARNKNKGPAAANIINQKKEDKKKERKNDRNRNHKNGPSIIRGAGVFSEGAARGERYSSRVSYGNDNDSPTTLQKPTIRVKDVMTIDKELEEQKIKSFMGPDQTVNDEIEDFKKSLEIDAPIKLPMDDIGWSLYKAKGPKVKQEVEIKTEPSEDGMTPVVDKKPFPSIKKEVFEDTDAVDLLKSDQPTLILIKLPDSLPGRVARAEDEGPRRKAEEPTTSAGDDTAPVDNRCYLKSLEEGRIGKLQIHRSGRVSLRLGDASFEVTLGTKSAYHQEVVSVATNDASRSANVVSLGPLHHKLTVVPDWEKMFLEIPS